LLLRKSPLHSSWPLDSEEVSKTVRSTVKRWAAIFSSTPFAGGGARATQTEIIRFIEILRGLRSG
jgi:hypothetical protein